MSELADREIAALAEVAALLDSGGFEHWLFGGWAVDFHVGVLGLCQSVIVSGVIPTPRPSADGVASSADGTRIAWYRYGGGERAILFVPTWNIVDARVVGHQVAALESHATVVTYDPRGAGASERPKHGYDFPLHAADALAVLDATGIEQAALVTASRGVNAAVLLSTDDPERFDRLAVVAPYMRLEAEPAPPNPEWLESLRTDWPGFMVPFMHNVFTEPDSADVIAEMIAIGLEATPEVVVTQELELDWRPPARPARDGRLPDARRPRRSGRPGADRARREDRGRDAERPARADSRRGTPARHPQPGGRQPAPAGFPPRPLGAETSIPFGRNR